MLPPEMPKRAAPLHDGEAGLALQHMNNVAKIGGFSKSSYKDQTNVVPFLTDSVPRRGEEPLRWRRQLLCMFDLRAPAPP